MEDHRVKITNPKRLAAVALIAAFAVGACGGGGSSAAPSSEASAAGSEGPAVSAPAPSGEAVSGSIIVAGSSTVEPISTGVAEAFKASNPDFNYTITGEGHRRRFPALLCRRDGHQRRVAGDPPRG